MVIGKKQDQTHLTAAHIEAGIKLIVDGLDQTYIDVPFAPRLVRMWLPQPCKIDEKQTA